MNLKLSAPSQIVWIIALILGLVGILGVSGGHYCSRRVCLLARGRRVGTLADRHGDARHVVRQPWSSVARRGARATVV